MIYTAGWKGPIQYRSIFIAASQEPGVTRVIWCSGVGALRRRGHLSVGYFCFFVERGFIKRRKFVKKRLLVFFFGLTEKKKESNIQSPRAWPLVLEDPLE